MARGPSLVVGLLMGIAWAGCAGSGAASEPPQASAPIGVARGAAVDGGIVEGLVLDDESNPLPDARVALPILGLDVATGVDGAFRFLDVPAGTYEIHAARLGHEAAAAQITVAVGQTTNKVFTLSALAIVETFTKTYGPLQGYFECAVGTPTLIRTCQALAPSVFVNDKNRLSFQLEAAHWETFVGDMSWQASAFGTSGFLASFMSYEGRAGNHWWCDSDGPSPNQFRFENEKTDGPTSKCISQGTAAPATPEQNHKLYTQADTGFGGLSATNPPVRATFQQHYKMLMTVFYGEPAPDGWQGFPDR